MKRAREDAAAAVDVPCRFERAPGGCRFGTACRFAHSGGGGDAAGGGGDRAALLPAKKSKGSKGSKGGKGKTDGFEYNFQGAEYLDHFETPAKAYEDIGGALRDLEQRLQKESGDKGRRLRIYDPYYCRGGVVKHLGACGFTSVHNKNEDCYASTAWKTHAADFDVVVTNPPYSGDHKERCVRWLRETGKPWFCLMWAFSSQKGWYRSPAPPAHEWYLVPKSLTRYDFRNPQGGGMRGGCPYLPMWYCSSPDDAAALQRAVAGDSDLRIVPSWTALTQADKASSSASSGAVVRTGRRLNPRQRAKLRKQKGFT